MLKTEQFRKQHQELLDIAGNISQVLDTNALANDATPAYQALDLLTSRIKLHLKMEDDLLYPRLIQSGQPEVANLANKAMVEMGEIAGVYTQYVTKWNQSGAIESDSKTFVAETKSFLQALTKRIDFEDNILYPESDKLP